MFVNMGLLIWGFECYYFVNVFNWGKVWFAIFESMGFSIGVRVDPGETVRAQWCWWLLVGTWGFGSWSSVGCVFVNMGLLIWGFKLCYLVSECVLLSDRLYWDFRSLGFSMRVLIPYEREAFVIPISPFWTYSCSFSSLKELRISCAVKQVVNNWTGNFSFPIAEKFIAIVRRRLRM